jgi:DNA-binding PadR family transcriptional regulator
MNQTTKKIVLDLIQSKNEGGLTAFEAVAETRLLPQTIYPCFTQLCKAGAIRDSMHRRKSPKGRNAIVWIDKQYGGVVPVWSSGHPTYGYRGRTRDVMNYLRTNAKSASVQELCQWFNLDSMSLSSLMSRLCNQSWIRRLPVKKKVGGRACFSFELTPRGRQVMDSHEKQL